MHWLNLHFILKEMVRTLQSCMCAHNSVNSPGRLFQQDDMPYLHRLNVKVKLIRFWTMLTVYLRNGFASKITQGSSLAMDAFGLC